MQPFALRPILVRSILPALFVAFSMAGNAQSVEPFVDHWDPAKTMKRSEGLMVNGREWGEWKFYDREGRLVEQAEFKAGERDGRVRIMYPEGSVQHDGYFKRGVPDSLRTTFYRDGKPMERGLQAQGKKTGEWQYWYPGEQPMLVERWQDSLVIVTAAWDRDGTQTLKDGNGTLRTYYGSGALQEESNYLLGVRSGPFVELFPAGNPKAKGEYRSGLKHGLWEYWGTNGEIEKREGYDKGKLEGAYGRWRRGGETDVSGWYKAGEKDSLWTLDHPFRKRPEAAGRPVRERRGGRPVDQLVHQWQGTEHRHLQGRAHGWLLARLDAQRRSRIRGQLQERPEARNLEIVPRQPRRPLAGRAREGRGNLRGRPQTRTLEDLWRARAAHFRR